MKTDIPAPKAPVRNAPKPRERKSPPQPADETQRRPEETL